MRAEMDVSLGSAGFTITWKLFVWKVIYRTKLKDIQNAETYTNN